MPSADDLAMVQYLLLGVATLAAVGLVAVVGAVAWMALRGRRG